MHTGKVSCPLGEGPEKIDDCRLQIDALLPVKNDSSITHTLSVSVLPVPDNLTGPCSNNDSGYIGKFEISQIKKPFCFVRLIPIYGLHKGFAG